MGQRYADEGKYTTNYIQYPDGVECVRMLNDWFSCYDGICADNHNCFQFKLKGKCRSAGGTDPRVLFVDSRDEFLGPCTQVHGQGLTPAIRAGKGWRRRRELAPRCSATRINMHACSGETHTPYLTARTTTTTTTTTTHNNTQSRLSQACPCLRHLWRNGP